MKYIYRYYCKITGKSYIGQTVDIKKRQREHKNASENINNRDAKFAFHRALRKHGLDNFVFTVLEECEEERADEREIFWINFYNSYKDGYNSTPGGQHQGIYFGKPVEGYDLQGHFIKKWDNAKNCAEDLGVSYSTVQGVLHGERKSCKSFQLKYSSEEKKIDPYESRQGGKIKVCQLDAKGNVLKTFNSIKEAGEQTGTDPSAISKVLKGKLRSTHGYFWTYLNKNEEEE